MGSSGLHITRPSRRPSLYGRLPCIVPLVLAVLALSVAAPALAADTSSPCPGCGMVWTDSCAPFERNNETAYSEELDHALDPVGANLTAIADYSNLSWSNAFRSLNRLQKERYAFTAWRNIDWDSLYARYAPRIAAAEKAGDRAAYYRALREYLFSIPDGHVLIVSPDDFGARYADIGGSYGIAVARLDSGRVIVSYVAHGSAAEKAGIVPGDDVTAWNGKPVSDAISTTPITWSTRRPSTAEGISLQQQRFLTRAPVGTVAVVTVNNASFPEPRAVSLTAYDDTYDTLVRTTSFLPKRINDITVTHTSAEIRAQVTNETVTTRVLPGGYTYIAVHEESYEVYPPFRAAVRQAIANTSPGIVLDLRLNNGGDDNLASCFAGWFVDRPVFYERATKYDPGTGKFTPVWESRTAPQPGAYTGPVAVLVSPYTVSSGEGLPMVFATTGRGRIISFYGTNGAFGIEGLQAYMPLNQSVAFPDGASYDRSGTIQVDSNATLSGGIAPTVRVPLTEDTVLRSMNGEDVQLAYAMQWLDGQQGSPSPTPAGSAPVPTAKAPLPVLLPVLAVALLLLPARRRGS